MYEEQENYEEALQILNEIHTIEPYNENFAYHTIKILMKLNNRVAAINYYKKFENNLRRNLDISPDSELKYLLELNKYYIYDLGYIQRNLLLEHEKYFSCCAQEVQMVPFVRIAEAFIKFITRALEIYDVKIKIINRVEMDPVSQTLLGHLEKLELENLWFEYEKE